MYALSSVFSMAVDWLVAGDICGAPLSSQRVLEFEADMAGAAVGPFREGGGRELWTMRGSGTSFESRLLRAANWHAHPPRWGNGRRELFLLLVTSSYAEIFTNFMCHVAQLQDLPSQGMFVVVTPHDDIMHIAVSHGLGTVLVEDADATAMLEGEGGELQELRRGRSSLASVEGSEFGMLLYQELVFFRTHAANVLLKAGFNVIICDIDTVWMRNPLISIGGSGSGTGDIFVTLDNEEICGCFLYLNNTENTKHFWGKVTKEHLEVVRRNAQDSSTPHMERMFESEQSIISNMIIQKKYEGYLVVRMLSQTAFPSGVEYFAQPQKYNEASIIHNNFIIGPAMKKIRFQAHNLWKVSTDWGGGGEARSSGQCLSEHRQDPLLSIFPSISRNIVPTLQLVLPVHNDVIYSDRVKVMVALDGLPGSIDIATATGRIWLERYPNITFLEFSSGFSVVELNVGTRRRVLRFAVSLGGEDEVVLSVDVGMNSPVFGLDMGRHWLAEASAAVWKISSSTEALPPPIPCRGPIREAPRHRYVIEVLAYHRPRSLRRLLTSLAEADYGEKNVVNLYIHIDHWKDGVGVEEVCYTIVVYSHIFTQIDDIHPPPSHLSL